MEPIEMSEFREKMEEVGEKHERNMMRVSLIISILAALVATVTVLGHREHTEAILVKADAGDQWQQYQSHRLRILQEQTEVKMLTLQPSKEGVDVQSAINDDQTHITEMVQARRRRDEESQRTGRRSEGRRIQGRTLPFRRSLPADRCSSALKHPASTTSPLCRSGMFTGRGGHRHYGLSLFDPLNNQ